MRYPELESGICKSSEPKKGIGTKTLGQSFITIVTFKINKLARFGVLKVRRHIYLMKLWFKSAFLKFRKKGREVSEERNL